MYFCLAPVISGLHAISVPCTCVVHVSTHSCVCMHVFLIFGAQLVYAYNHRVVTQLANAMLCARVEERERVT